MLMRRVEQQLLEVRRLMLEYEEAGEAVSDAARTLTALQLQHLQVNTSRCSGWQQRATLLKSPAPAV
jgi:hypothetical protein